MRDTHFLYGIATLGVVSIVAIFVGLATGTFPTSSSRDVSVTGSDLTTPAKKACDCCSERSPEAMSALRERLTSLRQQRLAAQKAVELIRQYGVVEMRFFNSF